MEPQNIHQSFKGLAGKGEAEVLSFLKDVIDEIECEYGIRSIILLNYSDGCCKHRQVHNLVPILMLTKTKRSKSRNKDRILAVISKLFSKVF